MGLFGNYNKEGPGIAKDAPKKRTAIVFLETFFRNFWKFATISGLFTMISIPLVTSGLASVGITNVARNTARDKHSFGVSDFFDTIKKNWRQALPAGIINAVVYAILIFDIVYFSSGENRISAAGQGLILAMFFIFTIMNYYMWTLMITFKFTLKQIYSNSFKFVFINFWPNLLCFVLQVLALALYLGILFLFKNQIAMILPLLAVAFVFTFPSFKFLLEQYIAFPAIKKYIIDPYYKEHPDDDIEKRRDLGLEIEDDEDDEEDEGESEDEERIFND